MSLTKLSEHINVMESWWAFQTRRLLYVVRVNNSFVYRYLFCSDLVISNHDFTLFWLNWLLEGASTVPWSQSFFFFSFLSIHHHLLFPPGSNIFAQVTDELETIFPAHILIEFEMRPLFLDHWQLILNYLFLLIMSGIIFFSLQK